jgi:hypothetical protein
VQDAANRLLATMRDTAGATLDSLRSGGWSIGFAHGTPYMAHAYDGLSLISRRARTQRPDTMARFTELPVKGARGLKKGARGNSRGNSRPPSSLKSAQPRDHGCRREWHLR